MGVSAKRDIYPWEGFGRSQSIKEVYKIEWRDLHTMNRKKDRRTATIVSNSWGAIGS